MAQPDSLRSSQTLDRLLGNWLCAVPILLLIAGFAIAEVDRFGPSLDAFLSMFNSRWLSDDHRSFVDVLDSLRTNSPQQGPVYYLLLHGWGQLAGHLLASGRVLSIFTSLLTFGLVYRLACDHIAPVAGLFAIVLLASNAFYAHYIAYIRMYSLLMLFAVLGLWLYLRLLARGGSFANHAALTVTCYLMLCTHAFSLLLVAAVGAGHLVARPKDGNWLRILAATLVAVGLFALTTLALETGTDRNSVPNPASYREIIGAFAAIAGNGSAALLAFTALGLIGVRRWLLLKWLLIMLIVYVALMGATSSLVSEGRVRYFLPGLALGFAILASGLYGWYRLRRLVGLLLLGTWLLAGWLFQQQADWDDFLGGRDKAYHAPPWHIISREARITNPPPAILVFLPANEILTNGQQIRFSMQHHYFDQHDIQVRQVSDIRYAEQVAKDLALRAPLIWLVTQSKTLGDATLSLTELLSRSGFIQCSEKQLVADTTLTAWTWKDLQCAPPQPVTSHVNRLLTYTSYGVSLDAQAGELRIRYRWNAADNLAQDWRISHQLQDDQRANVARLDLPLAHVDEVRQYEIDIADLPAGDYALFAIVYNAQTGERLAWQGNEDWIPEMQQLAVIEKRGAPREQP